MPGSIHKEILSIVQWAVTRVTASTNLRFQITMDIAQLMQFIHTSEHLCDVETCVFLLKNARIIQQRPEIASWNIFHGKIDEFRILESI